MEPPEQRAFVMRVAAAAGLKGCASSEGCEVRAQHACGRCLKVAYCSVACQRAAWKHHKRACAAAAAAASAAARPPAPAEWPWSWQPAEESTWGRGIIAQYGALTDADRRLHEALLHPGPPHIPNDEFIRSTHRRLGVSPH